MHYKHIKKPFSQNTHSRWFTHWYKRLNEPDWNNKFGMDRWYEYCISMHFFGYENKEEQPQIRQLKDSRVIALPSQKNHQLRNELQVARFVLLVICGGKFTLIWTILEKWKKMGIGCSQLVNYSFLRKKWEISDTISIKHRQKWSDGKLYSESWNIQAPLREGKWNRKLWRGYRSFSKISTY